MPEFISQAPIELNNAKETVDRLFNSFEVNPNPSAITQFAQSIDNGSVPIIASNHLSLVDIFAMIKISQMVNQQVTNEHFKGFYLPYDIFDPGQNTEVVKNILPQIKERCLISGITLLPIVIGSDALKIEPGSPEEGEIKRSRNHLSSLINPKETEFYGLAIFPEGETRGGITDEFGRLVGLHLNNKGSAIDSLSQKYLQRGIKFSVLPVGVNGSHQIFSPTNFNLDLDSTASVNIGPVLSNTDFNSPVSSTNRVNQAIAPLLQPEYIGSEYK